MPAGGSVPAGRCRAAGAVSEQLSRAGVKALFPEEPVSTLPGVSVCQCLSAVSHSSARVPAARITSALYLFVCVSSLCPPISTLLRYKRCLNRDPFLSSALSESTLKYF